MVQRRAEVPFAAIRLRQGSLTLAAIMLLALALRLAICGVPRVVRWDEAAHLLIAGNLSAGRGYQEVANATDLQQAPLLPLLALLGRGLGLPPAWAAALPSHVIFGVLCLLPLYALANRVYGRRVAHLAAVLAAIHPALAVSPLYWGSLTEPPFVFFVLSAVFAGWQAAELLSWRWGAVAGFCVGCAYLARPEAVAYLVVAAALIVGWRWRRRLGQPQATWRTLAAVLLAFVVVATPYVVFLHRVTGQWALSGKQSITVEIAAAYVAHDQAAHDRAVASLTAGGQEIRWLSTENMGDSTLAFMLRNPRLFAWQLRQNVDETWNALFHQDLFSPWLVATMAMGLFARPWSRGRWRRQAVLFLALLPMASLLAFFILSRFLVLVVPVGLIWAAAGLVHLADWAEVSARSLAGRRWGPAPQFVRALPMALTAAMLLWAGVGVLRQNQALQPWPHVEAGRWLASHAAPGSTVMARDSEVALYAGLPLVAFPNAEWPQVAAYARARGASLVAIDRWTIEKLRPQLRMLLNPDELPSELSLLAQIGGDDPRATFIYALAPAAP